MQNLKEKETSKKYIGLLQEKDKIILFGCLALGIIAGSVTHAAYAKQGDWHGTVEAFCINPERTAISITAVTLGFIFISFILGLSQMTRLLIYPAVCFRGMGLGTLICGILTADRSMGLCFMALVTLPYAVINCVLSVYAGEFFLGIHHSLGQKKSKLTKVLILHTIKIFAIYLMIATASCGLFVLSCYLFGKYLI